jgi:hypothetical protein
MSRQLPTYDASVGFQTPPNYNLNTGIQLQINALKEFNTTGQSLIDTGLKQDAQTARQTLKYNISQSMSQFAQEAQKNPDATQAATQFNESAKSYAAQLSGQTNPLNKGYVDNLSQYYTNSYAKPFVQNSLKQTLRVGQYGASQRYNQSQSDLATALQNHNYTAAASIYTQMQQATKDDFIHGFVSQSALQDSMKNDPVNYLGQAAISKYNEALSSSDPNSATQVLNSIPKGVIQGLSYNQSLKFHAMVAQATAQHLNNIGVTKDSVDSMVKNENARLQAEGGQPNAQLKSMYLALNKNASPQQYDDAQQHALFLYNAGQFFQSATPDQSNHFMDSFKPATTDTPDVVDKKFQDYIALQKVYKQSQDTYNSDKMAVAAKSISVQDQAQAEENAKTTGTQQPLPNSPFNPLTPSGVRAGVMWQVQHGSSLQSGQKNSVMPATNDFANNFTTQLQSADSFGKLQIMNEARATFGEYFPQFWNQVSKKAGLPKGLALAANVDPTDPHAADILNALATPSKQLDDASKTANSSANTDLNTRLNNIFSAPTSYSASEVASTIARGIPFGSSFLPRQATKLDLQLQSLAAGSGGAQADELNGLKSAAKKIGQQALLNGLVDNGSDAGDYGANAIMSNFNYSKLDGYYLAIPKQMSGDVVSGYLYSQKSKAQKFPFVLTNNSLGGQLSPEQANEIDKKNIALGHWITAPDANGAEWVDVNGNVRTDKSGNPFYVPYSDAFQNKNQIQQFNQTKIARDQASLAHYKDNSDSAFGLLGNAYRDVQLYRTNKDIQELTKDNQNIANKGMKNAPTK